MEDKAEQGDPFYMIKAQRVRVYVPLLPNMARRTRRNAKYVMLGLWMVACVALVVIFSTWQSHREVPVEAEHEVDPFEEEFKDRIRLPLTIEDKDVRKRISYTDANVMKYFPLVHDDGLYVTWAHNVNSMNDLRMSMSNDILMVITGDVKLHGNVGEKGTVPVMASPKVVVSDVTLLQWLEKISKFTNKAIRLNFHDTVTLEPAFKVLETMQYQLHAPVTLHANIMIGPNGEPSQIVNGVNFIDDAGKYLPHSTVSLGWTTRLVRDSGITSYDWPMVLDMAKYCTRISQPITFSVRAIFATNSIRQLKWLVSLSSKFTITIWTGEFDIVSMRDLSTFRKHLEARKVLYDVPESFVDGIKLAEPNSLNTEGAKLQRNLWQPQPFDVKSFVFLGSETIAFTGPNSWLTSKVQYQAELKSDRKVEVSGTAEFINNAEPHQNAKLEIFIRSSGVDPPQADDVRGVLLEITSDGTLRISSHNLKKAGTYNMETTAHIPKSKCYEFTIVDYGENHPITMTTKVSNCEGETSADAHSVQLSLTVPYESTADEVFYVTINGSHGVQALLIHDLAVN
ncbi:protein FAM151A-like [Ptychodera flava]|uniref:protein FAM151A-like n=1 Tax=Ptychodera flava TaxID=63121 RepID=UPI00396A4DB0